MIPLRTMRTVGHRLVDVLPDDHPKRWDLLATYNAEVDRGLVHTPEWANAMHAEQAAFDAHRRKVMEATHTEVAPDVWVPHEDVWQLGPQPRTTPPERPLSLRMRLHRTWWRWWG